MDHEGGDRGEAGTASPQSRAQQEWQNEELDTLDLRESPPHPSTSAAAAASSSSHPIVAHDDIQDFPPDFFDRPISFETAWRELREAEARIRPPPGDEEPKTLPGPLAGRGPQQQPRPASGSWQDTDSEDDDEEAEDEVYAGAQQMRRASTNGHLSDSESTTAENVCRICRCGPEPGQPLYHPCKCAGSIRYCHQDCLKEWLLHSRKTHCELCHHTFAFHKIYSSTMPTVVPFYLQTRFLIKRIFSWSLFLVRAALVVAIWLGFLPWANINFFRGAFWISDALLWVSGAGTVSWSGVVSEEMTRTMNAPPASASAKAAPSPLPTIPMMLSQNASQSASTDVGNGPLRSLVSVFVVFRPSNIAKVLLHPINAAQRILSVARAGQEEVMSWDWKTPANWISQDIFQGQILTCAIVLLVVSAWFTREWVIMNLPAHVPGLEEPRREADVLREEEERRLEARRLELRRELQQELRPFVAERLATPQEAEEQARGQAVDTPAPMARDSWPQQETEMVSGEILPPQPSDNDPIDFASASNPLQQEEVNGLYDQDRLRLARLARFSAGPMPASEGSPQTGLQPISAEEGTYLPIASTSKLPAPEAHPAPTELPAHDDEHIETANSVSGSGPSDAPPKEDFLAPRLADDDEDKYSRGTSTAKPPSDDDTTPVDESREVLPATADDRPADTNAAEVDSSSSTLSEASQSAVEDGDDEAWGSDAGSSLPSSSSASDNDDDPPRNQHARRGQNGAARLRRDEREGAPPPELPAAPAGRGLLPGPDQQQVRHALGEALDGRLNDEAAAQEAWEAEAAAAAAEADADWEEVQGELQGVLDAIGFRGDPLNVLANLSIVVALCSFFILLFIGLPYFVGRLFGLGAGLVEFISAPVRLVRLVTDPCFDWLIEVVWKGMGRLGWQWTTTAVSPGAESMSVSSTASTLLHQVANLFGQGETAERTHEPVKSALNSFSGQLAQVPSWTSKNLLHPIEARLVTRAVTTSDQVVCVFVGHIWLMASIATHLGIGEFRKRRQKRSPVSAGTLEEEWVKEVVIQVLTVFKVLSFLCIEIVVFPIGCGVALDLCTLPIFQGTLGSRYNQLMTRPFTYVFQLWFIGTLFMFRLGCLISHIRRTLRPGVLSWIRDPEDPDFQPIKEILERKTLTHLRKIGASATMYGGLIVCLFGVTCFLFGQLVKGTELLPLRLSGRPPFVPLDLLCVVFVLPALAKLTRPLKRASSISRRWWRFATYRLGIAEYFFEPKRIAAGARDSAKKEPSFYARVPDSDNSILGSPLMIQVDEGGQPISERGKEALQVQEEKIAKMKEPKAKYKVLCLPVGFGRRVKLLLFFLWASMAVGALVTVFVPIIVGRWILGDQADHHDVYAFTRGIIALSPLFPLADLLSRTKTAQWKLDRPSWGGEGKLQGNRRARRELRQSLWWTRPSTPLAKKRLRLRMRRWAWRAGNAAVILMSFGLLMPALVGLTVDQLLFAPIRFSRTQVAQTSMPYAWAMGLLEQEVFYRVVIRRLRPDWFAAAKETYRRGLRRPAPLFSLRNVFLPIAGSCLLLLSAPLLLASALEYLLEVVASSPSAPSLTRIERSASHLYTARLLVLFFSLAFGGGKALVGRTGLFEEELRDEVYLQASELKNFEEDKKEGEEKKKGKKKERGITEREGRRRRRRGVREDAAAAGVEGREGAGEDLAA